MTKQLETTVRFKNRDSLNEDALILQGITASATGMSWEAQGGPKRARLQLAGPDMALWQAYQMLRYGVEIRNQLGEPIWWGYVHSVDINVASLSFGLSLDNMSNSIAVNYLTPDGEVAQTDFLADDESVLAYGTKQLLVSADGYTATAATQRRANELNRRKLPKSTAPQSGGSGGRSDEGISVTLECRGWFDTIGWRYYSRVEGQLNFLGTSEYEQKLGLGFTSAAFGFEAGTRRVSQRYAKLGGLNKGDTLRITGSASNNGVFTVESGTQREAATYAAATISFDAATREVRDSANGLKAFDAHDTVQISGSASNNVWRRIESADADGSKFVVFSTLVGEAAGASVVIDRGHDIVVEEALVDELPGASVTILAPGRWAAQSFQIASDEVWTVASVSVRVRTVGSPADSLYVSIYNDSAGSPGSMLEFATILGSTLSASSGWATATFANTLSLAVSTTYWVTLSRNGDSTFGDYYEIMMDVDLGYTSGALKLYDGAGWVSRPTDADMLFKLAGSENTNTQMEKILATAGEFIVRSEVDASGTTTNQWRFGDATALVELEDLLILGTSNNLRMLAKVTSERTIIIQEEPTKPDPIVYFQRGDGSLVDRFGLPVLGYPPVGQWIDLKDVIPQAVQLSDLMRPAPYLLERAEYDVAQGTWRLGARDTQDMWDIAAIREG